MEVYERGTRLRLELNNGEVFEGNYRFGNKDYLTLENIVSCSSGDKQNNTYNFFSTEIISVKVIEDSNKPSETTKSALKVDITDGVFRDYDKVKQLINNYTYIPIVDDTFFEEIKTINMFDTISLIGLNVNFGRHSKISVLAIGTKNKVYLFDLKTGGEKMFDMGLRDILESTDMEKVVHNSKIYSDCLFHTYKAKMENVFDTQVADLKIGKQKEQNLNSVRSLPECVSEYLNLPKITVNIAEPNLKHLMKRPLPKETKAIAVSAAAYLYYLKIILEKAMFKKFYGVVDRYMAVMRDSEPGKHLDHVNNDVEILSKLVE